MFTNQKNRAKKTGHWLEYTREDLDGIVREALRRKECVYCKCLLTIENFSGDHKIPVARGGKWTISNLLICCKECNLVKGVLDSAEYHGLLRLVNDWEASVKKNLFARIKRGSRDARFARFSQK